MVALNVRDWSVAQRISFCPPSEGYSIRAPRCQGYLISVLGKRQKRKPVYFALSELDIRVDPDLPGRAFRDVLPLARERRLTTYDATYLELAMRLGLPLATKDAVLARAATALRIKTLSA